MKPRQTGETFLLSLFILIKKQNTTTTKPSKKNPKSQTTPRKNNQTKPYTQKTPENNNKRRNKQKEKLKHHHLLPPKIKSAESVIMSKSKFSALWLSLLKLTGHQNTILSSYLHSLSCISAYLISSYIDFIFPSDSSSSLFIASWISMSSQRTSPWIFDA